MRGVHDKKRGKRESARVVGERVRERESHGGERGRMSWGEERKRNEKCGKKNKG